MNLLRESFSISSFPYPDIHYRDKLITLKYFMKLFYSIFHEYLVRIYDCSLN